MGGLAQARLRSRQQLQKATQGVAAIGLCRLSIADGFHTEIADRLAGRFGRCAAIGALMPFASTPDTADGFA